MLRNQIDYYIMHREHVNLTYPLHGSNTILITTNKKDNAKNEVNQNFIDRIQKNQVIYIHFI